jgi:hypothetical protein
MSLKKHDTGIPMNTPTDPNSVIPGDGGSTGWLSTEYYKKFSD